MDNCNLDAASFRESLSRELSKKRVEDGLDEDRTSQIMASTSLTMKQDSVGNVAFPDF
jgi:hypothetical protein